MAEVRRERQARVYKLGARPGALRDASTPSPAGQGPRRCAVARRFPSLVASRGSSARRIVLFINRCVRPSDLQPQLLRRLLSLKLKRIGLTRVSQAHTSTHAQRAVVGTFVC
jgi:hypothetical protein